jgi:UDP-glucose 4-epimerase
VLDACRTVTGHPVPVVERDRRPGDPTTLVASNARARELLGWLPGRGLEDIVSDAWAFVRTGEAPR